MNDDETKGTTLDISGFAPVSKASKEAPKLPDDENTRMIERALSNYQRGNKKAAVRHLADALNTIAAENGIHGYAIL